MPPDLLRRVLNPKGGLHGTRPEDYGLPQGERLNELITQSWNRLRKHWAEFRAAVAKLPDNEPGTGLTNDKWSLPLLRELGFGLLPTSAGPEVGGRTYAINRFFGPVPVHLVGCGLSLDRRAAGVRGAAAINPHGLVQEFVNRSPGHIWGIVSNGLGLRVLRDNQALSRQSFLEFDLEAMFAGEVYSEFVLLWLMVHATRFAPRDGNRPESCWLEEWSKLAEEQGTRALGDLRGGVENALQMLGEGFTSHPKNTALRDGLRTGQVPLADFHGQLLRVVYRLIFLFVAEDRTLDGRPLLHPRDDSDTARIARERFAAHYGTARLREMAANIKGSRHGDLWNQFQLLVGALSGDVSFAAVRKHLALPALGSFLWDQASTAAVNGAELTNHDFLESLRYLAFTRQGKVLRPVDYENLGAEELGGVYESLLALTPQVSADGARFSFAEFAGNERKTSGSYYTPDSLVQCLLDSALDPVVEQAIGGKTGAEAANAILSLKICDPAVGSGHFLVGAAHRMARHLARVRALAQGESEPSLPLYQHALREVIGRCLYGVDMNPMAAELCRVGLWLEALEPGKPLSFLDHHIRVGNSLLGTTPELVAAGLPDDAFTAIEGDDKKVCSALKKRNEQEREGQRDMHHVMVAEPDAEYNSIAARTRGIDESPDDTINDVQRKAEQFRGLIVSSEYRHAQQIADAWCAAFMWKKPENPLVEPLTTDTIHRLATDVGALSPAQRQEVERLSCQYQFFHWHLAFPEVVAKGGFDCVFGNPPWERFKVSDTEFFAERKPEIALIENAAKRQEAISALKVEEPKLFGLWIEYLSHADGAAKFARNSGRFPLAAVGELNSHGLFVELSRGLVGQGGSVGIIVPSGLATDKTYSPLFENIVSQNALVSLYDFENRNGLFPGVHRMYKFCLVTLRKNHTREAIASDFVFFATSVDDLRVSEKHFRLTSEEIGRLNPNTRSCPIFSNQDDALITKRVYGAFPILSKDSSPKYGWMPRVAFVFEMNKHSHLFGGASELRSNGTLRGHEVLIDDECPWVALYEAKQIHQFDHRFATYVLRGSNVECRDSTFEEHADPFFLPIPRQYVRVSDFVDSLKRRNLETPWFVTYRDITNAANERTSIFTVLPYVAMGNTWILSLDGGTPKEKAGFVACMNMFATDYIVRRKVGGSHLNFFVLKQLAVPLPEHLGTKTVFGGPSTLLDWVLPRTLELIYTAWDLEPFARDCGWFGPPFRWDDERRFLLRCELDAAFFHLYLQVEANGDWRGVESETAVDLAQLRARFTAPRDAVAYIMDTFPIVRRRDEEKWGDYRTKRVVLEIYDALAESTRTGQPYQSRVNPLSGPPIDSGGMMLSMYQLDRGEWPAHLHPPHPDWEESLLAGWFRVHQQRWTYVEDEQMFPWDGREAFAYALIPYLVQERPGKKFEFYRDAALLASYPKRCETLLLEDAPRENYRLAMRGLDWLQFPDAHRIRPGRIREMLQGKKILRTDANSGATTLSSIKTLPPSPSELRPLIPLILNAADNLERVQRDAFERVESMKLGVNKEDLARELSSLMVA